MYTRYLLAFLLPLLLELAHLGSAQRITSKISSSSLSSLSTSSSIKTHSSSNSTIITSSSTQRQTVTSSKSRVLSSDSSVRSSSSSILSSSSSILGSSSSIGTQSSTNSPVIPPSNIPNQSATSSRSPISSSSSVVPSQSSDSASSVSSSQEPNRPTQPTSSRPISITAAPAPPGPSQSQSLPPFVAPTVTSTVPISIGFPTPTASPSGGAGGLVVHNPRNPRESVTFGLAKVPEDKRHDLPGDVSDLAPLALLLLGSPFPVLLFSGFSVVFPIAEAGVLATAGTWLTLSQFPTPKQLSNDDGKGGDHSDPEDGDPGDSDPEDGEPSQSEAPSRTSEGQSRSTSNPASQTTSRATSSMSKSSSVSSSSSSSSSSSAPQGKPTQYLIFPKPGNADLVKELSANLTRDLGSDKVLNSIDDGPLNFWAAFMDPKYAEHVQSKSFIEAVEPDMPFSIDDPSGASTPKEKNKRDRSVPPTDTHGSLFRRVVNSAGYEDQTPVGPQLGWISHTFASKPDHFFCRPVAGNGVKIYIIDTGVQIGAISGQTFGAGDYIYGGIYTHDEEIAEDRAGHGTCVAAMAADLFVGVAKRATIVPVKLKTLLQPDSKNLIQVDSVGVLQALERVLTDIRNKNLQKKAVLNMSFRVPVDDETEPTTLKRLRELIGLIMAEDVPVILSAGNAAAMPRGNPLIDTYPQLFEGPNFPIINVGAVDLFRNKADFSQKGPHLNVYAFGQDVTCRDQNGNLRDNADGTSFAAPQVAGLAAYFLSLTPADGAEYTQFLTGQTVAQMKAKILRMATKTGNPDVSIIHNGADDLSCVMGKRQEGGPQSACSRCVKCSRSATQSAPSTLVTIPSSRTQASSGSSSVISTTLPGPSASASSSPSSITSTAFSRSTTSQLPPSSSISASPPSSTVNCQQFVPPGGPAPSDIASAIRGPNDSALETICAAKFDGSGDLNQMTFNHGNLIINVARTDTSKGLQHCQQSILQIIDTCILDRVFGLHSYGGAIESNGEKYNISNLAWPENPLIPGVDPGAPTPTPTPTTSITTPPSTPTTPPLPPAQTVTINGAICILRPGSVTPQCQPIETPTPNPGGTNIHVESGSVNINFVPLSASEPDHNTINIPNTNEPWLTATIYANFNPDDHTWGPVTPGCELQARWPADLGDIYLKGDNCLYDGGGNKIWDNCCTEAPNGARVTNPYGLEEVPTCECIGVLILGVCVGAQTGDGC